MCVMTYLNVVGQGQIDISKIAIFNIRGSVKNNLELTPSISLT